MQLTSKRLSIGRMLVCSECVRGSDCNMRSGINILATRGILMSDYLRSTSVHQCTYAILPSYIMMRLTMRLVRPL